MKVLNVDTVDGMAEGAFYGILDKTFPVLVSDDGYLADGSIKVLEKLREILGNR